MIVEKIIRYQDEIKENGYDFPFKYLIKNFKEDKKYRIIDIGAGANPWSINWITHAVDCFIDPIDKKKFEETGVKVFEFDIDDTLSWNVVLDDVEKNGKFDFVICSHTLEDINYPKGVCRLINQIGNAGYIAMPSKYSEFCGNEDKGNYGIPYKGYHHHRWIYTIKNNILVGYPKLNFLEYLEFQNIDIEKFVNSEIAFIWEESFDYEILYPHQLLDNRVGPNRVEELYENDDFILT